MAVWTIVRGARGSAPPEAGGSRAWVTTLAALGVLLWLMLTPTPAEAATFIVSKVADTSGPCNPGNCSLRSAINAADASAAIPHVIQFSNPMTDCASAPCVITLSSPMTAITRSAVVLDGSSAPGGRILISGNNQAVAASGLTVVANSVTISSVWVYGFGGPGISIVGNDNLVVGSWVGNVSGTVSPNSGDGIFVVDSERAQIGGDKAGQGNVASGNGGAGIKALRAVRPLISGNIVGLQPLGLSPQPNVTYGIVVESSREAFIGGSIETERNVISKNGGTGANDPGDGIFLSDAFNTVIMGNYIGLSGDGSPNFGNKGHGIAMTNNTDFLAIGGAFLNTANQLAYNGGAGIRCYRSTLTDVGCKRASLNVNFIYLNAGLGMDLFDTGVTTNDPLDADTGPNGLQNFPELTSVVNTGNQTYISGTLDSRPNRAYKISFYAQSFCDPSGFGEALTFMQNTDVTTNANGRATFTSIFPNGLQTTLFITAFATDVDESETSEFSSCRAVQNSGIVVTPTSGLQTTESGGQATFTVQLTTSPSQDVTVPVVSGDLTEGTVSPSVLTFTSANGTTPQTVTVTGVADVLADGDVAYTVLLTPATSNDPVYHNFNPPDVSVTNVDVPTPPPPPPPPPAPTPPPGPCSPRPAVGVSVVPDSAGRLRVTLTATGTSTNRLSQLRGISTDNAEVELDGQPPRTGAFTVPLSDVQSLTFRVRRAQAGQSTTVRLAVTDGCGEWETLVGGGANAFP